MWTLLGLKCPVSQYYHYGGASRAICSNGISRYICMYICMVCHRLLVLGACVNVAESAIFKILFFQEQFFLLQARSR